MAFGFDSTVELLEFLGVIRRFFLNLPRSCAWAVNGPHRQQMASSQLTADCLIMSKSEGRATLVRRPGSRVDFGLIYELYLLHLHFVHS